MKVGLLSRILKNRTKSGRAFNFPLFFLLVFLFCLPLLSRPQEEIEEEIIEEELVEMLQVSLSELALLMQENESVIILSNLEIILGKEDALLMDDHVLDTVYEISPLTGQQKKIHFFDCNFNTGNSTVVFSGWVFSKLDFLGCEINSPLIFENFQQTGNYPIHLENCTIANKLQFKNDVFEINKLEIVNCLFRKNLFIDSDIKKLVIENCRFDADTVQFKKEDEEKTHFQLTMKNKACGEIELNNCRFFNSGISNLFSIDFSGSTIESLSMFSNKIHSIDLSWSTVEKSLLIDSLEVEAYIGILNFDFPSNNTNIPWYNFSDEKLALLYTEEHEELITAYQAKTIEQLANTLNYNDLISSYTKFNTLYHDRGDIRSANKSYVEVKTIETRRQKYLLKTNWDFNVYINYQLNVFLSFFSDYATNPGKSLIQSLWVLLIFTFLYMFSFSGWDGMNYPFYLKQFNDFAKYIKHDKPIGEIYPSKENPHKKQLEKLHDKYLYAGKKVPKVLLLFGIPLYFFGKFRFDLIPNLIRLLNFQPEKWDTLKGGKKVRAGMVAFFILLIYSSYILVVKFLNSFILSLNHFVVIGFGSQPEDGDKFAMYLSIIEGIIGWFLLTIFTITLLSQVLQGA